MFDAKDVTFVWNEDAKGQVTELAVGAQQGVGSGPVHDNARFPNSRGSGDEGWMANPGSTPEGLFMELLATGFADRHWFEAAVIEFANVTECEWARKLAPILRAQ